VKEGHTQITRLPGFVVSADRPSPHTGSRLPSKKTRVSRSSAGTIPRRSSLSCGVPPNWRWSYNVAADGRFLALRPRETVEGPIELQVVLNWFEELERLAPHPGR